MYMRFLALLMCWLAPLFRNIQAMSMTGSLSQNFVTDTPRLSYSEIPTSGREATSDIFPVDGTVAFFSSSTAAVSTEQVTSNLLNPSVKAIVKELCPNEAKRKLLSALASKKSGIALALLFFVGFLIAGLKGTAATGTPDRSAAEKPREKMISGLENFDDKPIAKARARLEKVKGLLPAASRLASAVDSADSEKLMAQVQEAMKKASEVTRDGKELENYVTGVLEVLQKLQRAAGEKAAAIEHLNSSFSSSTSLRSLLETITAFRRETGQETVYSYFTTLQSLYELDVCMSQRFSEVAKRISAQKQFKDETHGERLLATAIAMEGLREINESRRRLALFGGELSEAVVAAVKGFLVEARTVAARIIGGFREILAVRSLLAKSSKKAGVEHNKSSDASAFRFLRKALKGMDALRNELSLCAEAIGTSTTLEAAIAASRQAVILDEKAHRLIVKCTSVVRSLPAVPERVGSAGSKRLMEGARKAHKNMLLDKSDMLFVLQEMLQTLKKNRKDVLQHLNAALGEGFVEAATELEIKAHNRMPDFSELLPLLKEGGTTRPAMNVLKCASSSMVAQSKDKSTAKLMELDARLLVLLEKDMSATVNDLSRMLLKKSNLSGKAKAKYEEAESRFDAARKAAKNASTLLEAAQAAAELRTQAFTIQGLLLSHEQNDDSV